VQLYGRQAHLLCEYASTSSSLKCAYALHLILQALSRLCHVARTRQAQTF
jgi:hypothetical protein